MNWHKEKLGAHCEITSSKRIFYSEYVDSGIPFYRSKEIIELSQGQSISEPLYISQQKYEEIKSIFGVPSPGDMLLTSVGTIGVPYIVTSDERFYFKDGNLTWFRNFDNSLLSKYLYYWICSSDGYGILNNTTIGSSQKALTITSLKKIELPIPPIDVQYRIVDILSAYDSLIENNQKQIKLLEEAAQRLYKEWFVNLRFPGYENVKIIDGVPEGWEKKNLGSLIEVVRGRSYSSDELSETGGVLMVNLSNIRPFGGYNRAQEKHYNGKYTQEQTVKSYDLIMGLTDMTQERRTVGRVAIVPELRKEAIISMDLIKLVPKEGSSLFFYALLSFGGYSEVISRFANGTNVLHLRPDVLDVVDVLSPPKVLQENYSDFFKNILNKINDLQDQILLAIEARDRLLPKLMSGEIEL